MPKPTSKAELQARSTKNFERLCQLIDALPAAQQQAEFPRQYLNRNIRDVLAHLHHWQLLFLNWYEVGMAGDNPHMPAEGYTWKMNLELNRAIQKQYSNRPLKEIRALLATSHTNVQQIIDQHSNEELFEKQRYHWTGSTSLGAYLIGATSSHYDWGYQLMKKCVK